MREAVIFNIQKFCINDGPGIRTTVFFKGCPLNCLWCHNPESKLSSPEISFHQEKCLSCRRCAALCPNGCHIFSADGVHTFDRTSCVRCGRCTQALCGALETIGRRETVSSVLQEVRKDKIFYENSGGGMTLSGGEPMLQYAFVLELLQAAKAEGLHTAMETCGFAKPEQYREIAAYTDLFLFDYKETDPALHQRFTGVSNEKNLGNLQLLDELGAKIILRCPIIPTMNERADHFSGIAQTANRLKNILEINLEPYHPLGSGKCAQLGKAYPITLSDFPSDDTVAAWISAIQAQTSVPVKKA